MEMTLPVILGIIGCAFICEFIDSSLGMMYGTILSPLLIIFGFEPLLVVPSILLSQSVGGFTAAVFHHRFRNADFHLGSDDSKAVYIFAVFGIMATVISVFIAINISKAALMTYIGILVICVGIILFSKARFAFSWRKIWIIGILSGFNKGISGGGFGPLVTSGQVISGRKPKRSIGTAVFAEAPVCIAGFLVYLLTKGISDWRLVMLLIIGAVFAAPLGALLTSKFKTDKMIKTVLGILTISLGIWVLIKTWLL